MKAVQVTLALAGGLLLGIFLTSERAEKDGKGGQFNSIVPLERGNRSRPEQSPVSARLEEFLSEFEEAQFGRSNIVQNRAEELNLARFCREARAADLPELFEAVANLHDDTVDPTLALRILGARWAELDPHAASKAAALLEMNRRAAVEHAIWPVWARHNLGEFRAHMENLQVELGKNGETATVPLRGAIPWVTTDPIPALEAHLERDLKFFRDIPKTGFAGAPPLTAEPRPSEISKYSSGHIGNGNVPPMLEIWLRRDQSAAMNWAQDAISRDEAPPRFRFLLLDQLSGHGYDAAAADLALDHLTEDLQVIVLERILKRWAHSEPEVAQAWKRQNGLVDFPSTEKRK